MLVVQSDDQDLFLFPTVKEQPITFSEQHLFELKVSDLNIATLYVVRLKQLHSPGEVSGRRLSARSPRPSV